MHSHDSEPPVWVDKEGVAHYNGDPSYGEEWEERALLGFAAVKEADRKLYPLKLKNALTGRAWTMTRKRPEISILKLTEDAEANPRTATEVGR